MPQPTPTDVHVDAILTGISVAYMQDTNAYIANRVFPDIPVDKQSDKYYLYTKGDWFRDEAAKRAPNTESVGSGYTVSTTNYQADVYAIHKDVDDQTRANADNPINVDADATRFVTQRMLLRKEAQWITDYFTTGKWATDIVGGGGLTKWSDYAASDPINDLETAKQTILSSTGLEANTLVMGYEVFRYLKNHPDIVDRFKYTSSNNITEEILARVFEVDRILVARAIQNTAVEGATAAFDFMHGKHALLCHVAPNPGLMTPSAGYSFSWRGVSDGLGATVGISRIRMPHLRSDRVEAQMAWDNKIVATDLGYFFSTAV